MVRCERDDYCTSLLLVLLGLRVTSVAQERATGCGWLRLMRETQTRQFCSSGEGSSTVMSKDRSSAVDCSLLEASIGCCTKIHKCRIPQCYIHSLAISAHPRQGPHTVLPPHRAPPKAGPCSASQTHRRRCAWGVALSRSPCCRSQAARSSSPRRCHRSTLNSPGCNHKHLSTQICRTLRQIACALT